MSVPLRAFERIDIGLQLDQVARHEARSEPEMARDLHQQPRRVAARAGRERQRFLRLLHAGFHADEIADSLLQAGVELDQEIDGALLAFRQRGDEVRDQRPAGSGVKIGREIDPQVVRIREREVSRHKASTKKSNGLITDISAMRSTSTRNSSVFSGKTNRASQLPCGSCCQLMKCCAGRTFSE